MTEGLLINVVYEHLQQQHIHAVHRGDVTVLVSPRPVEGGGLYFYADAYSFHGKQTGMDVLLLHEPAIVLPGQYDEKVWDRFDYIFTFYDALIERWPHKFRKVRIFRSGWLTEPPVTENLKEREDKYPCRGRRKAICMINGNKTSRVPGELYTKRRETALWFHFYSDIPFDVYGNPPFMLPNYNGVLGPQEKYTTLSRYRYCLCYENINHPDLARGYVDKILDCLEARTIPIYLGCPDIEDHIPPDCFIDARKFRNYRELDDFLHDLDDRSYESYIRSIDAWVAQGGLRPYSMHAVYTQLAELYASRNGRDISTFFAGAKEWEPGMATLHGDARQLLPSVAPLWSYAQLAEANSPLIDYDAVNLHYSPDVETFLARAEKLRASGEQRQALEAAEVLLQGGALNADLLYLYAQILMEMSQYEESFAQLERVIMINPAHSLALNDLGALYMLKKDFKQAVQYFHAALQADGRNCHALDNLLSLLVKLGFDEHAVTFTQSLLTRSPDDAGLRSIIRKYNLPAEVLVGQPPLPAAKKEEVLFKGSAMQNNMVVDDENVLVRLRSRGLWQERQPLRLHLGCGENHFEGYVNIDYPPAEHSVQSRIAADLFADITLLDFPEQSVDEIRLHHVFEHFGRPQALALLIRWHAWLKIGGRLHIETPDAMGSAQTLVAAGPSYKAKQAVLRHLFGSHEASWAYHLDGWYQEKFESILSRFGFAVRCQKQQWNAEPWLSNVHAVGIKERNIDREELLGIAEEILGDSMVAAVPAELKMHGVWCDALRKGLGQREGDGTKETADGRQERWELAGLAIKQDAPDLDQVGFDITEPAKNGEFRAISAILRAGDIVFDVGANRGNWCRQALAIQPRITLFAFEPVPSSFAALEKGLDNSGVKTYNLAFSCDDREKTFYHCANNVEIEELSSFYRRPAVEEGLNIQIRPITVTSRTLDAFCREQGVEHIDFLKIDVEGGELDVLMGASGLLGDKKIETLQFEYGGTFKDAQVSLRQVYDLLTSSGYRIYRIIPDGLVRIAQWRAALENYRYSNYLALAETPRAGREQGLADSRSIEGLVDGITGASGPRTLGIVFSKDRAMQLDCTLRSFFLLCQDPEGIHLSVLYKCSTPLHESQYARLKEDYPAVDFRPEKNFQDDLMSLAAPSEYILFLVDDNIFVRDFSLKQMIQGLVRHGTAVGFSLRLGRNTTYCYMLGKEQALPLFDNPDGSLLKFDWTKAELDFGYPLELSSSLYRTADILPFIGQMDFANPNTLEMLMAAKKAHFSGARKDLLCFERSVAFCNPANMVQTMWINRAAAGGAYTVEKLAELFAAGCRINVDLFSSFTPNGCHQERDFEFLPPQGKGYFGLATDEADRPLVTIGIPNYNGLQHIKICLESIRRNTPEAHEIIVVDNGSTDGSHEYLRSQQDIILVENSGNVGAPGARNQFLALSRGEYIVFLDNDTIVTKDWIRKLVAHMESDPQIGIIGASSNYATGLQGIAGAAYKTLAGLEEYAERRALEHRGELVPSPRLISFCVFIRRAAVEKIGGMETGFSKFCFEDDDYSLRISIAGFKSVVAGDVFIHHTGGPQGRGDNQYNKWLIDAWEGFKGKWGLPKELPMGASYDLERIVGQTFEHDRHYIPLPPRSDVERLVYRRELLEERVNDTFSQANTAAAEGRWDEALRLMEELLRDHPGLGVLHAGLGSLLVGKGDYQGAIAAFEKAVELLPGELDLRVQLARLCRMEGQTGRAGVHILKAVQAAPADPEVLTLFGIIGAETGNVDAAQTALIKLKQLAPEHAGIGQLREILSEAGMQEILPCGDLSEASPSGTPVEQGSDQRSVERDRHITKGLSSIVIVLADGDGHIEQCLDSIDRHTPERHEIIVLGCISRKAKSGLLKKLGKSRGNGRFLDAEPGSGRTEGINRGIGEASGEYIIILSPEVRVTESWLAGMVSHISKEPAVGIVGPMTVNIDGPQGVPGDIQGIRGNIEEYAAGFRERNKGRRIPVRSVNGFCVLLKSDIVRSGVSLDRRMERGHVEMEDLCLQAAFAGFKTCLAGDVFVFYHGRPERINRGILLDKWSGIQCATAAGQKLALYNALEQGRECFHENEIDKAVERLVHGLKFCPREKEIYFLLAEILIDAERFLDAKEALESLPDEAKGELRSLELLGYVAAALGRDEEASTYADRVLDQDAQSPPRLNLKGVLAYKKGNKEAAEKYFRGALACDPCYGAAYANLGVLCWSQDKKEEGFACLEKAVILAPIVSANLSLYQQAVMDTGLFDRAAGVLREAAAVYPRHKKVRFAFIAVLLNLGRDAEAMREIEEAMLAFGIDDDLLAAALQVREKIGPREISAGSRDTLSICLIVKNEEKKIARCLGSLSPVASELIVVDTGSSDRTKDIARAFGAKIYDFAWTEDFSEARNYSLAQGTGKWILVHDADEVLSALDYEKLRAILQQKNGRPIAYTLVTRNYTTNSSLEGWTANVGEYPGEEAGIGWYPSPKVRLFRNDPRVRFQNPVHELLEPALAQAGFEIKSSDITIHHYGELDPEKDRHKAEVYYELGKKKLAAAAGDARALRELAIQAGELGRFEEAVELFEKYIMIVPDNHVAYFNMATAYLGLGKFAEALHAARKSKELSPDSQEALLSFGTASFCNGNFSEAVATLEDLLKKVPDYPSATASLAAACYISGDKRRALELLAGLKRKGFDCSPSFNALAEKLISADRQHVALPLLACLVESGHGVQAVPLR